MKFIVGNTYTNRRGDNVKLLAIEPKLADGAGLILMFVSSTAFAVGEVYTLRLDGCLFEKGEHPLDLVPVPQIRWGILYSSKNGAETVGSLFKTQEEATIMYAQSASTNKTSVVEVHWSEA